VKFTAQWYTYKVRSVHMHPLRGTYIFLHTISQWFVHKTCPVVCYSQAIWGEQKCHGPAQYLFYVFKS